MEEQKESTKELNVEQELRAMLYKLLELATYTDISGVHSHKISSTITQVLRQRGENYRL